MAMLSRIIRKCSSSVTPLANTTAARNYSSAIIPAPLKNSIINPSCGNHFSREVVFPRTSMATLHSYSSFCKSGQAGDDKRTTLARTSTGSTATKKIAMPMTSTGNFTSRSFSSSGGNTDDGKRKAKFPWKIENFSEIKSEEGRYSRFNVGGSPWQACIYPKGEPNAAEVYGRYLSLYLWPVNFREPSEIPSEIKKTGSGYVKFKINIIDQNKQKSINIADGEFEFCEDSEYFWNTLIPLSKFHDPASGYLLNDTCIIKIKVYYNLGSEENSVAGDMKEINPKVQKGKRQHKFSELISQ